MEGPRVRCSKNRIIFVVTWLVDLELTRYTGKGGDFPSDKAKIMIFVHNCVIVIP